MLSDVCSDMVSVLRELRTRLGQSIEDSRENYPTWQIIDAIRADTDLRMVIARLDGLRREIDEIQSADETLRKTEDAAINGGEF